MPSPANTRLNFSRKPMLPLDVSEISNILQIARKSFSLYVPKRSMIFPLAKLSAKKPRGRWEAYAGAKLLGTERLARAFYPSAGIARRMRFTKERRRLSALWFRLPAWLDVSKHGAGQFPDLFC